MSKIDILNRDEFVDQLVNLTKNISDNRTSTSFAINGVWGCGKSFVLDMYEQRLSEIQLPKKAIDRYFVIRYNCWKYDYYEEPLVAIVAAMIDIINQKTKLWNDEQKKARVLGVLKAIGTTFLSVTNDTIKGKIGVDLQGAYDTLKSGIEAEQAKIEQSHDYDMYFSFNQALERLQKLIGELSQEQTIVFMVDELDRCLPEYAIKVLERLHHLTENSSNVITVLAMDKSQLQVSIKQIFGFEHPEKYLEKFIQFEIKLNCGSVSERVLEKYADYIKLFDDTCQFDDSIDEFMQKVLQNINARRQEQIFKKISTAHSLLFQEPKSKVFMCMEVLITVLHDCYDDNTSFCDFLKSLLRTHSINKPEPPFASFFNDHFEQEPRVHIQNTGLTNHTIYKLSSSESLYCDILYLWCGAYEGNNQNVIRLANADLTTQLDAYIEDLKKFKSTIKFIK